MAIVHVGLQHQQDKLIVQVIQVTPYDKNNFKFLNKVLSVYNL